MKREQFILDYRNKLRHNGSENLTNHNNELGENEWIYSVVVADSGAFWLCSYDTEEEALAYIRENGLQMVQG